MKAHAFVWVDLVVERIPEECVREFKTMGTSRPYDSGVDAGLQVSGDDGGGLINCVRQHKEIERLARYGRDSQNLSASRAEAIGVGSDRNSNRARERVST